MSLDLHLRHRFGPFTLDATFQAPPGLTVLFGRSGSGKSSIINAVAGLLSPDEGQITVAGQTLLDTKTGRALPPHRRRLGTIFQDARLFPHLSVGQNLRYGRWFAPRNAPGPKEAQIIEMLGLGPLLSRRPGALSGGERQRVAIGRALLAGPRLILADEPLAALDAPRKAEILPYFERLRDETQVPILYVTHSAAEVARLATTVIALEEGRVTRQGPPGEILSDPSVTPTGARAAGAMIEATVAAHHDDGLTELIAGHTPLFLPRIAQPPGARVRLRIGAQEVVLARHRPEGLSALNILPGTISAIRAGAGPGALISLQTDAGMILARVTRRSATALDLAPGQGCYAILKAVAIAPQDVTGGTG